MTQASKLDAAEDGTRAASRSKRRSGEKRTGSSATYIYAASHNQSLHCAGRLTGRLRSATPGRQTTATPSSSRAGPGKRERVGKPLRRTLSTFPPSLGCVLPCACAACRLCFLFAFVRAISVSFGFAFSSLPLRSSPPSTRERTSESNSASPHFVHPIAARHTRSNGSHSPLSWRRNQQMCVFQPQQHTQQRIQIS
jgi:hypothetical protein